MLVGNPVQTMQPQRLLRQGARLAPLLVVLVGSSACGATHRSASATDGSGGNRADSSSTSRSSTKGVANDSSGGASSSGAEASSSGGPFGDGGAAGEGSDAAGGTAGSSPQPECCGCVKWAVTLGGPDADNGGDVAIAPNGSAIVVGDFRDTVSFSDSLGTELSAVGEGDVFIASLDAEGALDWATSFGGEGYDRGYDASVAVAPDGSLRVGGNLTDPATFGSGSEQETTVSASIYLARFLGDGSFDWVSTASSEGWMFVNDVGVLADGGSALAGEFVETGVFGAGEAQQTSWSPVNSTFFGATYHADGSLAWVVGNSGEPRTSQTSASGMDVSSAGDLVVTGMVVGVGSFAEFGAGEPAATSLSGANGSLYVARFHADGTLAWAKQAVPISDGTECTDVCVEAYGQSHGIDAVFTPDDGVVVVGTVSGGRFTLGSGEVSEIELDGSGSALLAKWGSDGSFRWVKRFGGYPDQVAVSPDGTLWVSGSLPVDQHVFGAGEANEKKVEVTDGLDAYVARFAADGSFQCLWRSAGSDDQRATGLATYPDGGAVVTGFVKGSADLGSAEGEETIASGESDAFVVRLSR